VQALDVGLVDALGGLDTAVAKAKALAQLPPDTAVAGHPPRRTPLLLRLLQRSGLGGAAAQAAAGAAPSGVGAALSAAVGGAGGPAAAPLAAAAAAAGPMGALAALSSQLFSGQPQLVSIESALVSEQV
jgi:protease-4